MVWNFSAVMAQAGPGWVLPDRDARHAPDPMRARLEAAKMALLSPERVERLENGLGWRIKPASADPVQAAWLPMEPRGERGAP